MGIRERLRGRWKFRLVVYSYLLLMGLELAVWRSSPSYAFALDGLLSGSFFLFMFLVIVRRRLASS